ncbi:ATP-binding cassette sub- G member 8 [Boothiomyces sp. JEL0866]|nr:ATP-binding cassette sub- G member 8 [Boothiomyces sp. JEL0866]KAJ3318247.1 ATP-binding cassette sub- G member 8 [Boothiomyces sp. JEL0866]
MVETIVTVEPSLNIQLGSAQVDFVKVGKVYGVIGDCNFNETILQGSLNNSKLTKRDYALVVEDSLPFDITVYDSLLFTANLKFPCSFSLPEKHRAVESIISKYGLNGSDLISDVDNRKAVLLAQEMLTNPELLLVKLEKGDDQLLDTIKKLVRDERKVALVSLDPSCNQLLGCLDSVIVFGNGGLIWDGSIEDAIKHFSKLGYPLGRFTSPVEYLLDLISADKPETENKTKSRISELEIEYKAMRDVISPLSQKNDIAILPSLLASLACGMAVCLGGEGSSFVKLLLFVAIANAMQSTLARFLFSTGKVGHNIPSIFTTAILALSTLPSPIHIDLVHFPLFLMILMVQNFVINAIYYCFDSPFGANFSTVIAVVIVMNYLFNFDYQKLILQWDPIEAVIDALGSIIETPDGTENPENKTNTIKTSGVTIWPTVALGTAEPIINPSKLATKAWIKRISRKVKKFATLLYKPTIQYKGVPRIITTIKTRGTVEATLAKYADVAL